MITDTIEFIQLRIDQMLADINRSEEQFLRNYADSNKIQIAYMLGQREMLAKMMIAAQEEE
jgi:hypothetical protein|tara:strand:- start:5 stop:187 length:183 start_codon:yes stop_codon:yes gene_type:complete